MKSFCSTSYLFRICLLIFVVAIVIGCGSSNEGASRQNLDGKWRIDLKETVAISEYSTG